MTVSIVIRPAILFLACLPFVYYILAIYDSWAIHRSRKLNSRETPSGNLPPASILKPVRGLDWKAYENFATFCRQDYPEYEILFCVGEIEDPVVPVIEKLIRDFPAVSIRLLIGAEDWGANDKVNKLCRLVRESRHEFLVVSDADVCVSADYLSSAVTPLMHSPVGLVTSLFRGISDGRVLSQIDCVGAMATFCANAIISCTLEGVRFALGATMAIRREFLSELGGFETIAAYHSDDYELAQRVLHRGLTIQLLHEPVEITFATGSFKNLVQREFRNAVGLRHLRAAAHFGQLFTHGLVWVFLVFLIFPSTTLGFDYALAYLVLRGLMAWSIYSWGLEGTVDLKSLWLIPCYDALGFASWFGSFFSDRIEWRETEFVLAEGKLKSAGTPVPRTRFVVRQSETDCGEPRVEEVHR